ncbi:piggyBac transposable element-derived protein 4-like [Myripristis murdjan]|uniref:piggyBac transposable element-derived protein 4-like n=1 Tax=Myripristis murdjan TaxID=586833 RepID=UPI0011760B79|nr:piggyBac transposable element-derived protein 4-like [Myripristis murdjan]
MTVQEALEVIIDHDSEIEEDVSEDEDHLEINSDSNDSDFEPDVGIAIPIPPSETYMSKNGEIQWSSSPNKRQAKLSAENIIKTVPGPTRMAVTRVTDIKSTFELVMPDSIKKVILEMTNLEGRRVFGENWKELDKTHLDAYLGLLILAGVYKSKDESTASLWDAETGRAIFPYSMSLETFHIFSRVIRFDNRETRAGRRERDKLAAIRTVWDKWVEQLPLLYNSGPNVTVDERLVAFRGRCPFRQYMPSKPAKYGIKIWAACDANTSYALNMQVYTGKPVGGAPEKNQGTRVVLDMAQGLRGHNITCDNFFTNYNLGQELLKRKLTMVGTVRKNRAELPAELLVIKNRAPQSSMFAFTDTTALVSYCPKKGKNVVLMSTLHKNAEINTREDQKPSMILDYNATKGGVDNLDKVTGSYSTKRMTARWPLVIFYNMLDVSAYNAFVIWTEICPDWNVSKLYKRRIFLEELGKALVTPHIQRRQHLPRTPAAAASVRDIQERTAPSTTPVREVAAEGKRKRKRCQVCRPSDDVKTSMTCVKCAKFICTKHSVVTCHSCAV